MKKVLHFLIILQFTLLCASKGYAQLPNAELLAIIRPVAKAGTTEKLTFSGSHTDDVHTLRFSDQRIKVSPEMLPADEFFSCSPA